VTRPAIGFKPVNIVPANNSKKYRREGKQTCGQAKWDGQPPRCPKKGELYLSGAHVTAYEAPNDLSTCFFIATPV
jgi:hypothetical protein